jgi:hypothetical protein
MEIKNRDTGAVVQRAELVLDGRDDVEKLRRALDAYDRHVQDPAAPFVIPVPLPSDAEEGVVGCASVPE